MGSSAISFATVCPLPSLPLRNAALLQILETCTYPFPTFPYTHADATAQPLVGVFQEVAHIGKPKVGHPPSDSLHKNLLAPFIADVPAAGSQLLETLAQLGLCLRMDAQVSSPPSCVERVAEVLLAVHAAYMGLLTVYLQEKLLLDVTADAFAYPFSSTRTLAENDAIVSITDKRKTTTFKFAVKLVEHNVAQYRA